MRTAVVAGTASAVAGRVQRHQARKFADRDAQTAADQEQAYEDNHPERALSDGPQALLPEMFKQLVEEVRLIHGVLTEAQASLA